MAVVWLIFVAVPVVALIVGDLRDRHLDNRLVLLFTALVCLAPLVAEPGYGDAAKVLTAVGSGAVAFLAGLLLYRLNAIAAGDVKLLFAIAAVETWFGSTAWFVYLGCAIVACLATLVWLLRRRSAGTKPDIPLGPVLLAGVVPSVAVALPLS